MVLAVTPSVPSHCTNMYPMALMCLSPLSGSCFASLPQVLESSGRPPVPNPILELQLLQSFCWLLMIPILALEYSLQKRSALNPSMLQLSCNEAREPISFFHVLRPSEVLRYFPSAISEYRELACLLMTMKLICWPIFIPRQILEKDVLQ